MDNCILLYKMDKGYHPASQAVIRWDDPDLNIQWPIEGIPVISQKDAIAPLFKEYVKENGHMKILITGISGFVGRNLRKHLPVGHEYFILARTADSAAKGFTLLQGDLNDLGTVKDKLAQIKPDACIHLAWEGIPDYGYETSVKNLKKSSDLFRFLVKECHCHKIVSIGSCWEYGKNFGACAETDALGQGSYFVWAKRALCDLGLSLAREEKINFVWLRFFYVYGPGQRDGALIPTLVRSLKKNECPQVRTPLDANDYVA